MGSLSKLSVLIVEDSKVQRQYLVDVCLDMGLGLVREAENGQSALEVLEDLQPDVLICDLEMPGTDGVELIDLLSKRKLNFGLVIVSSREASLIHAVELMAITEGLCVLGALQKPVRPEALAKVINRCDKLMQAHHQTVGHCINNPLTEADLHQALLEKRFLLHFQPKVALNNKCLVGVEALVRLEHQGRLVFPVDFIHVCEKFRLIDELTLRIIEHVFQKQRAWMKLGLRIPVNINLSATSFDNQAFCARMIEMIKGGGIPAGLLVFEVTETGVVKNIANALKIMAKLRLLGCGLSIDDFGTGYSSVKQLSQLPFTELKVDRSLIDGISQKSHLQIIFESTLSMCSKLHIQVVAEGIETAADWHYLTRIGCHIGQGYLISPPMAEAQLLEWIGDGCPLLTEL
ncbi:EAL domain-containing response regulator [Shewanella seohaensis]|uniref:EAL domain-containing protein n=1 Tax=Shewanella seohaensis TaxID=755175 RepID=A0ABV4VZ56_9GAMM